MHTIIIYNFNLFYKWRFLTADEHRSREFYFLYVPDDVVLDLVVDDESQDQVQDSFQKSRQNFGQESQVQIEKSYFCNAYNFEGFHSAFRSRDKTLENNNLHDDVQGKEAYN